MHAETAKAASYQMEVKKDALRQTQSGDTKVTFTINPVDMPPALYADPMGQRYMAVLVPLNDDETPKLNEAPQSPHTPGPTASISGQGEDSRRSWDQLPYVTRAGILCSDDDFKEYVESVWGMKDPAEFVRNFCAVESRKQIDTMPHAQKRFHELREKFITWRDYERNRT